MLIVASLLVAGGLLVSRAASTISALQSQSTPPPSVDLALEDEPSADEPAVGDAPSATAPVVTVDTAPARESLSAAGVTYQRGSGLLDTLQDGADRVTDLAQGAGDEQQTGTALKPMTILLMGVDARPGEEIDIGVRPDSLAVLRLDPETGSCRMLNIPRDSRVDLPGYGMSKINHALAVGGIPYQRLVVENFLSLPIDRYALVDFGGVEAVVDAIGGVTVTVSEPFTAGGAQFQAGERTLTGAEALIYARYRGGPDGDFGRIKRQQQILRSMLRQAAEQDVVRLIRELLPEVEQHTRTDLTLVELVQLASRFRVSCTDETIVTMTLDGTVATLDDALFDTPLSFVIVDDKEVRRKVAALLDSEP
jgi:LCP family protein required for cell wall assembly